MEVLLNLCEVWAKAHDIAFFKDLFFNMDIMVSKVALNVECTSSKGINRFIGVS